MKRSSFVHSLLILSVLSFVSCSRRPVNYSNGDNLIIPKWEYEPRVYTDQEDALASAGSEVIEYRDRGAEDDGLVSEQYIDTKQTAEKTGNKKADIGSQQKQGLKKLFQKPAFQEIDHEDLPVNSFAMTGFVFSLLSLAMPFLIPLAIVFSAIGLYKIKNNPEKYRGRGFAIAGIAISVSLLVAAAAIFYTMEYL